MDNTFISLAKELETIGLRWIPEVGDEVSIRDLNENKISILVDANGMNIYELRENYIWLPTIEQLVSEIEARGGVLFHAGKEIEGENKKYKVVVNTILGAIKCSHENLRGALAVALKNLILNKIDKQKIS